MAVNAALGGYQASMRVLVSAVGVEATQRKIQSMSNQIKQMQSGSGIAGLGEVIGASSIAATIGKIAMSSLEAYGNIKRFEISMKALAGNEAGAKIVSQIQQLGIDAGITANEMMRMGQFLMATGTQANALVPTVKMIATLTARAGGDSTTFGRIALAIGQIRAAGVLRGQELRQLTEAGVSMTDLAHRMNMKPEDLLNSNATVPAETALKALFGIAKDSGNILEELAKNDPVKRMISLQNQMIKDLVPIGEATWKVVRPMLNLAEVILKAAGKVVEFTNAGGAVPLMFLGLWRSGMSLYTGYIGLRTAVGSTTGSMVRMSGAMNMLTSSIVAERAARAAARSGEAGIMAASRMTSGLNAAGMFGGKLAMAGASNFIPVVGNIVSLGLLAWAVYDLVKGMNEAQNNAASSQKMGIGSAYEPRNRSDIENMQADLNARSRY